MKNGLISGNRQLVSISCDSYLLPNSLSLHISHTDTEPRKDYAGQEKTAEQQAQGDNPAAAGSAEGAGAVSGCNPTGQVC